MTGPLLKDIFSISFNDFYYQPPLSLRFGNNNNRGMQRSAFSYLILPFFFNEFLFVPMGCWNKHEEAQHAAYCSGGFSVWVQRACLCEIERETDMYVYEHSLRVLVKSCTYALGVATEQSRSVFGQQLFFPRSQKALDQPKVEQPSSKHFLSVCVHIITP